MQTPSPRALRERVSNRAAGLLKRPSGPSPDPAPAAPAAAAPKAPAAPPLEGTLLEGLLRGEDLTTSVLTQVREWVADGDVESAVSLTESLRRHEQSREVGDLASGVLAFQRGLLELAWARFTSLPRAAWATYAPEEFTRCGLETARQQTVEELRDIAAHDPAAITLRDWVTIVGVVFGAGEQALAGELFDVVEATAARLPADADRVERNRAWLEPWVRAEIDRTAPRGGRPAFAVVDYGHPGMNRGSANIGDHVQSIASLGHLVRHRSVRLHGEDDLVALLDRLGSRTRPALRLDGVDADVDVMTIHRDASMYQEIPEGTWTLCFGWFMHPLFKMRYGFPLHSALRPLFVSFHCNKRELLTDDAIAYLKRYGPVGCRDWTTVYLLLSAGVPAFFSGCMTTTVSTVFPEADARPDASAPVGYVDVLDGSVPAGAPTYHHSDRAVRRRSFLENCDDAVDRLETYRRDLSKVVTSRLHAYLPLRSLGVPVDFKPGNMSDIRFDGLAGITDEAFSSMRDGIIELLQETFTLILSGASEEEVYGRWRELTAGKVAEAEARLHAPAGTRTAPPHLDQAVATAVAETVHVAPATPRDTADEVHCAVFVTKSDVRRLAPLVRSLATNSSRPLHVWLLGRPKAEQTRLTLARAFPEVTFSWVRTGGLDAAVHPPIRTPNSVARLVLADLLPGVQRVVVLPAETVVDGDVAELAALDLGEHAFASARSRSNQSSGFQMIHSAAARLRDRTALSSELRRTAHARHAFDFDAFGTDLLVVDLPESRRQQPPAEAVALMADFRMQATEVLHYLAGPDHAEIPDRWQHVPSEDAVTDSVLVHWTGITKPWGRRVVPEQDRWRAYAGK